MICKSAYIRLIIILFSPMLLVAQHAKDSTEVDDEFVGHHCFNQQDSFAIGLGVPFSFLLEAPGINLRGYYNINHNICFGPEISYFKSGETEVLDIDIVGHYIFELPWVGIYPVVGVNFTSENSKHENERSFGVLFGGGIHRNFNRFTVFSEFSHVQSSLRDNFLTLGVLYVL